MTNISPAGPGKINVEKCEVTFSPWGYYHIENGDCVTTIMYVEAPSPGVPPHATPPPASTP